MIEYELLYLIGESKKSDFDKIDKDAHDIVSKYGGTWIDKQVTEERRLAYDIKHETRGLYVAQRFTLPNRDEVAEEKIELVESPVTEMNRELVLHTSILRAMIVRADDLPDLMTKEEKETLRGKKQHERERYDNTNISGTVTDKQVEEALHIKK